jgi:hypothetical protein
MQLVLVFTGRVRAGGSAATLTNWLKTEVAGHKVGAQRVRPEMREHGSLKKA